LTLTSADRQRRKSYWLTPEGLRFEYQGLPANSAATLRLPLALDPWRRFASGWADLYGSLSTAEGWGWQLDQDLNVQVRSSIPFTTQSFLASRPLLTQTEDPNVDYPAGHLLAFPLALVEFTAQEDFYVEIEMKE
jgi:hypothetical protein